MRKSFTVISLLWLIFPVAPAIAQGAIINWSERVQPITKLEYDTMIRCTLEKHPDSTKRYSQYHVERRDKQTPDENVKDPDSSLLMESFAGCFEFENGKQIPFSLDGVIYSWYRAHFQQSGGAKQ